ncbi:MAG: hypothetical protein ABSF58_10635 [Solirubrobacteraceae bacterium]|jgi:hypothetical protein
MESSRRLTLAATLGFTVIAIAAASDFVFGSFWSSHAMLTSLLASLIVLAVTVVVLNEIIDRRDRRRWSVLGQYVLFQLVQSARATWMGTVELVTQQEIETGSTEGLLVGARLGLDTGPFSAATRVMLADPERRRVLQEMLVILGSHSRAVVANWAAVMVGAGPYTEVFDRHVELQARVDWLGEILSHNEPTAKRTFHETKLARSSVSAEFARQFGGDDWLHDQIVSTTQLALRLDYESRALGWKLVPLEAWNERVQSFIVDLPTLSD